MSLRLMQVLWLLLLYFSSCAAAKPNVLFLVVDDLRPMLGSYGESHMVTPNLDQLARKSIQFQKAYIQQAVCSPSRTSFLTGRRPDTTRIFDLQSYFRNISGDYTTLPQYFKENGYIAQSVGKIFHRGVASGGNDDYPHSWTNPPYHSPTQAMQKVACPGEDGELHHYARCPVDVSKAPGGSLPDIQNTDFAIHFLHNRSLDKQPFFLGLGFLKPHLPFEFPQEYLDLYPLSEIQLAPDPHHPAKLPDVAWTPYDELRSYDDIGSMNLSFPFGAVPVAYQYLLRQAYAAAVSYTDAQVGRILSALDQYGFADNTIVTFHGDHGWQLGEHGEWCKHTNFDIATRVPLFIYAPGVTSKPSPPGHNFPFFDALLMANKSLTGVSKCSAASQKNCSVGELNAGTNLVTDALVEIVDLYATITQLAGLPVPPTCPPESFHIKFCTEGSSLVPLIKNVTSSGLPGKTGISWKPAVFSQYPRPSFKPQTNSDNPVLEFIRFMGYTMLTDKYRYTQWLPYDPTTFTANWSQVVGRELYVHAQDPLEDNNVADDASYSDLIQQLSKQLAEGWRGALPH